MKEKFFHFGHLRTIVVSVVLLSMQMAGDVMKAATIELQEYLGYMWKTIETVDYGEVCVGATASFSKNGAPLRLELDGVQLSDVKLSTSSETLKAEVAYSDYEEYNQMFLALRSTELGDYRETLTIEAGDTKLEIPVTAIVADLGATTISALKEDMTVDTKRYYYTGEACVTYIDGSNVWVNDETGGIQLSSKNASDFMPGDIVTFNGQAISASFDWKYMINAELELVEFFNWREAVPTILDRALSSEDYGRYIRVPKASFVKNVTSEAYGVEFNDYYFTDSNGNEFRVRSYDPQGSFAKRNFEIGSEYDLTACVWPYNKDAQTMPEPVMTLTRVRDSEPPFVLTEGNWEAEAAFMLWPDKQDTYQLTMRRDETDPYKYYFDNFIKDFNGGECKVFAYLTPDGSHLEFPAGQCLDGMSTLVSDKFFSGYDSLEYWTANPTNPPYRKGTMISAQIDHENMAFEFDVFIACMSHNVATAETNPEVEWGTTGGYKEGVRYYYKDPSSVDNISNSGEGSEMQQTEYYDITGCKVVNPKSGNIYIRKRGTTVTKVIF